MTSEIFVRWIKVPQNLFKIVSGKRFLTNSLSSRFYLCTSYPGLYMFQIYAVKMDEVWKSLNLQFFLKILFIFTRSDSSSCQLSSRIQRTRNLRKFHVGTSSAEEFREFRRSGHRTARSRSSIFLFLPLPHRLSRFCLL